MKNQSKLKLLVVSEDRESEHRVAITPEIVSRLKTSLGYEVFVEKGAGELSGFQDSEYEGAGAKLLDFANVDIETLKSIDVVFSVNPIFPAANILQSLKRGAILISGYGSRESNFSVIEDLKLTFFALDAIPRTTRAQYMDILSSQANLAGYRAMIEASHLTDRVIPLMMTTAGTIPAARVLVIGAGVAGLQAIATAKRLGAIVSAFDVRQSAKEQVESLGAKFIDVDVGEKNDGVYAKEMSSQYQRAQEMKLREVLPSQEIIISTAQIPGRKAPIIIKNDMVQTMKPGSVIIDLAARTGGNCELTVAGRMIEKDGIKIVGFENILNLVSHDASKLFAKNMFAFWELLSHNMDQCSDIMRIEDDIIRNTLITYKGEYVKGESI